MDVPDQEAEMRAMGKREAEVTQGDNEEDDTAADALGDALKTMGLDALDPAEIAEEFRDPLIRLAPAWSAAISEATLSTRRCDLRRFSQW